MASVLLTVKQARCRRPAGLPGRREAFRNPPCEPQGHAPGLPALGGQVLGEGPLSQVGAEWSYLPESGSSLTAFKEQCPWLPRVPRSRHPSVNTVKHLHFPQLSIAAAARLKRGVFLTLRLCRFPCRPITRCKMWPLALCMVTSEPHLEPVWPHAPAWGGVTLPAMRCRQVATRLCPELQQPCGAGLQAFCKFRDTLVRS